MHRRQFEEAGSRGRANVEAIELMRRHCRHARIQAAGGNSHLGEMLGLPLGRLEVRCEHASPPFAQRHQALELAIEFYEANCAGCAHRDGTDELPNLATVAKERAAEKAAQKAAEQEAADGRARRRHERRERRHRLMAGEGHVVRDLAGALDLIDRPEGCTGTFTPEQERAARQILDAARGAPELFRPVLVDSLLELAADTADATAFEALQALAGSGHCPPRRAFEAARAVLRRHRCVDAGRLLAVLEPDLRPEDLPDLLDRLIALASGEDNPDLAPVPWRLPASPEGLIAASHVDLPSVSARITEHLASDDESTREAGADAARVLLAANATRVTSLGPALAASVRGPERGYAGYPHPTSAALRALAEAWRGQPALTRGIVEAEAAKAAQEVRDELSRVPWFLQRFRGPWDASAPATSEAISFVIRRACGDWGDEAADRAASHLTGLADEIPGAVAAHIDEMLGTILALCAPDRDTPAAGTEAGLPPVLAALERKRVRVCRDARRHRLAMTVGRCASVEPAAVLTAVLGLFSATTGDEYRDRAVRTTMLQALQESVSAKTLPEILPIIYRALLDADDAVRAGGIGLWAACVPVTDSLPADLTELSIPLLEDQYVSVHRRMLKQIPYLSLPGRLAPKLLPIVLRWVVTYAEKPDPGVLASAIWALRCLAQDLDDPAQVTTWFSIALAHVGQCGPYDRQELLTAWWPEELRTHQAWTRSALATAASTELIDYYNLRHEPVLQALMDRPQVLAGVPLAEIEPLSSIHGPWHPWRALELVELLQSAGRWADAARVARAVHDSQPPGEEGAHGRCLAITIARGAELARALAEGPPGGAELTALTGAVKSAATSLQASLPDSAQDCEIRSTLDSLMAPAIVPALLLAPAVPDPVSTAEELNRTASLLLGVPSVHASGAQRAWIAHAWQIAALLLRYDAAIRAASGDASAQLQAARRQAQVLRAEIGNTGNAAVPDGLNAFLTMVECVTDPDAAQDAWKSLAHIPPPVSLVGTSLLPRRFGGGDSVPPPEEPARAVCVATLRGVPVTDTLVVRPGEVYHLGMTVRLVAAPAWAERCIVEPVTMLGPGVLTLPRWEFSLSDGVPDEFGITLSVERPLYCGVEQPILAPALDCPIRVSLAGEGRELRIDVAGFQRLLLRPFDPSRDTLIEHEQTSARLLAMFATLEAPEFDTEDARAFCRLFAACVRAAQVIMFEKVFMAGSGVSEAQFHDELERLLRADSELGGRLTRRDAVAGGFDDLLHDDVIAELKVSRGAPVTIERCARYIGQPAQYGVGRGSQLSVLVVFDHGRKEAPPGVIDNYIGWLRPRMHGRDDPRYPSLVGVLIVNTNLPVPSEWSRRRVKTEPLPRPQRPAS